MSTVVDAMFRYPLGDDAALIPATPAIAAAFHELTAANRERLARWEPWAAAPVTPEKTRGYLEAAARGWLDGTQVPVAIAVAADRGWQLVGSAGLRINAYSRSGEIGYWIDAHHEGRGLVSRTTVALLDQAFGPLGLGRVTLGTTTDNHRSRAVARRLGFTEEGILRGAVAFTGTDRRDEVIYGLLAPDWRPSR